MFVDRRNNKSIYTWSIHRGGCFVSGTGRFYIHVNEHNLRYTLGIYLALYIIHSFLIANHTLESPDMKPSKPFAPT